MADLTDSDRARLREMTEKDWVNASLSRDFAAWMALCTDDFVYMPQDHPVLHGKDEAIAFLNGFPDVVKFTQSMEDVSGDSALAACRGSFAITVNAEGQHLSGTGKFLCTATKASGQWLISAACFNWDAPLA